MRTDICYCNSNPEYCFFDYLQRWICKPLSEQVGRDIRADRKIWLFYHISMFFILPFFNKGFWLKNGKSIYIILGIILIALYCIGWIIFWKEDSVRKSLYLSILPSLLFIESAVVCGNLQLLIFAVLFAPCHILISYMNAIMK